MKIIQTTTGKARSPRYPVIGLGEAIERVRRVYAKDHLNTIPKSVVVEHMGYTSLNGASLGIVSAVSKYGLLEGGSDGMKISDRALAILVHEQGEPARAEAIEAAAHAPTLFEELFQEFPNGASDNAIKSHLLGRKKFIPAAAAIALRAFKDTLSVVQAERGAYDSGLAEDSAEEEGADVEQQQARMPAAVSLPPVPLPSAAGFEIGFTGQAIRLVGNIGSQEEADKVLKAIEALKLMLPPAPKQLN